LAPKNFVFVFYFRCRVARFTGDFFAGDFSTAAAAFLLPRTGVAGFAGLKKNICDRGSVLYFRRPEDSSTEGSF
jgi:hypothetical protein